KYLNHLHPCSDVVDSVLLCCFTGSSAVTPVFVQKGKDLINTLVTFSPGKEPIVSDVYTGRVEASVKNFSVKLKNLQEADSGVYIAQVTAAQGDKILARYSVTVQVSPVALTVDSVSSSSDSCSLTVTCSTQDSHHINSTFTCDTNTCSQEGGERSKVTTSGASLNVYLLNDLIICNHSNQVSWTNNSKMIDDFCWRHTGKSDRQNNLLIIIMHSPEAGISLCLVKTVVFSVGLVIMVSAVISVHLMEKLKRHK
uniref:Immunoglobulin V-set domain-containing protein n=1 Tax=Seriola dumerili TaxID=41447 RepID=A0A3B4TPL9_SERDU